MNTRNFQELSQAQFAAGKSVCVGLDSKLKQIPPEIVNCNTSLSPALVIFNKWILKTTSDIAWGYKLNSAFYEEHGPQVW